MNFTVKNERAITIRGRVMITDPCYFIEDNDWQELCDIWYPPSNKYKGTELSKACVVEYKGARILIGTTAYGDGQYKVRGAGHFGVDAGCMCVVQVDELLATGLEAVDEYSATYLDVGPDPVIVTTDGKGRFEGAVHVDTTYEEENYDGDDECDGSYEEEEEEEGDSTSK